jgi:TolB-like protein
MKRNFILILSSLLLSFGCGGTPPTIGTSTGISLDDALLGAARRIDERIEKGTKIALLNFISPTDAFSNYVLNEIEANLLDSGKLTVVDRKESDLIRSEFDFQFSGEVADDSMQDIGRMLGAQSIVSGSLTEIGGIYRLVIRVLQVESAAVATQYRTDIINDSRVKALLAGGKPSGTVTSGKTGGREVLDKADMPVPKEPPPSPIGLNSHGVFDFGELIKADGAFKKLGDIKLNDGMYMFDVIGIGGRELWRNNHIVQDYLLDKKYLRIEGDFFTTIGYGYTSVQFWGDRTLLFESKITGENMPVHFKISLVDISTLKIDFLHQTTATYEYYSGFANLAVTPAP